MAIRLSQRLSRSIPALLASALLASAAQAAAPPSGELPGPGGLPSSEPARAESPSDSRIPSAWLGRYCTPLGCKGRASDPLLSGAGFAAAILAGGWLARRRSGPTH